MHRMHIRRHRLVYPYPVIGFDDIKEIFQLSINADKPVHIMLVGPHASAKSLLMNCLAKLE